MREEVAQLLKNPDFMERITDEQDKEKVKEIFLEKGIDLSHEEVDDVGKEIYDSLVLASKLSDKQVENISGGDNWFKDKFHAVSNKVHAVANWGRKKVGLPTPEEEQAEKEERERNEQILQENSQEDTWMQIADRNKGKLAIGATALTLCAVYGVKNIKRYLNKSRKKKNWINSQKSDE